MNLLSIFKSKNDGVIVNSYLPTIYEKIFEVFLFQIPTNWNFKEINYKSFDISLRKKINLQYDH